MSNKIYVGQSSFRLTLTAGVDITAAITTQIKYRKPDATEDAWDATVETAATGVIYHDFSEEDAFDAAGRWTVWAYIEFSDGRDADGEPYSFRVYMPGR